jgi:myosin-crossreactive antigen
MGKPAHKKSLRGEEMTRKDYIMIAKIIAHNQPQFKEGEEGQTLLWILANQFATELQADNPRFDRARFLAACGVK